jgi:hypothetical protein
MFSSLLDFRTMEEALRSSDSEIQNGFTVHTTSQPNGLCEILSPQHMRYDHEAPAYRFPCGDTDK